MLSLHSAYQLFLSCLVCISTLIINVGGSAFEMSNYYLLSVDKQLFVEQRKLAFLLKDFLLFAKMDTVGRCLKPIIVCQYGKECAKTDPDHFMEYTHQHLDEIIAGHCTTVNDVEQYQLPEDITIPKDLVLQQIGIIKELFPSQNTKTRELDEKPEQPSTSNEASFIRFKEDINIQDHVAVIRPQRQNARKTDCSASVQLFFNVCHIFSANTRRAIVDNISRDFRSIAGLFGMFCPNKFFS